MSDEAAQLKWPIPVRVVVATLVGLAAGWMSYRWFAVHPEFAGGDFTYPWRAAGHLLAGRDPYQHMPNAPYGTGGPFLYPLPAAIVVLPFALLEAHIASGIFFGLSVALMTFALSGHRPAALLCLLSPAFVTSVTTAQWGPIVIAGVLLPWLGWLSGIKPNLGLIAFAYRPKWSTVVGGLVLLAISLVIIPYWPLEWLEHLGRQPSKHKPVVLWPMGFIGLLALLRWRTPEGRLLLMSTIVPTASLPYDHLLLWLVARTWKQAAALTAVSWGGYIAVLATAPHDLTGDAPLLHLLLSLGLYLPAAAIVLRHPNAQRLPARVEHLVRRLPSWLKGTAQSA